MSDYYNELLKKHMEREAKKIAADGATEQDRYGHLLDSVKGRNIEQEEADKRNDRLSNIHKNVEETRKHREKESAEWSRNMQRIVDDVSSRDRRNAEDFVTKHKELLDKTKETISRERNKSYFD